jgi:hypothetical protein
MECSARIGNTVSSRSDTNVSRCLRVNRVRPLLALMAISTKEIGLTTRTVSGYSRRLWTFGVNARSEMPAATLSAVVSSRNRNSGTSLEKSLSFFHRQGACRFANLLRRHLNNPFQGSKPGRPSCRWLYQLRNHAPMTPDGDPLAILNSREQLSKLVFCFGNAHVHMPVLAILWLVWQSSARSEQACPLAWGPRRCEMVFPN